MIAFTPVSRVEFPKPIKNGIVVVLLVLAKILFLHAYPYLFILLSLNLIFSLH